MATVSSDSVAQDQLRAFIERIERMEEEKKAISDDIKEIYAEAKGNGFDTKVLRQIVRIRKQDQSERMEQEAILDTYLHALGMGPAPAKGEEDEDLINAGKQPVTELPGVVAETRSRFRDSRVEDSVLEGRLRAAFSFRGGPHRQCRIRRGRIAGAGLAAKLGKGGHNGRSQRGNIRFAHGGV